jgi:ABC-type nitrate/sulfonate/bicarbonate transport system substrate-binding protein
VTVSIRLLWHKQAQFAGYLVAEALRLGRKSGVDIVCDGVDFSCKHVGAVLAGKADMAVASPAHVLESADPDRLSVVLVVQQASPLVYVSRPEAGIRSVGDLRGRRVAVWPGEEDLELRWMLAKAGLPERDVTRVAVPDTVSPLLADEVDCAQMTTYHELHQAEAALGHGAVVSFSADGLGCSLVKDGLVLSRDWAAAEPERVQAVMNAVLEGWTLAFADPERTVDICHEARPDMPKEEHRAQLADIRRLTDSGATRTHGLGYPDPLHAARAAEALAAAGAHGTPRHDRLCDLRFWRAAPAAIRPTSLP